MIRLAAPVGLDDIERFGLDVLIDQSRLLLVEDAAADVVMVSGVSGASSAQERRTVAQHWARGERFLLGDGTVSISSELLRAIGSAACALTEQQSGEADRHGRVPSTENELFAEGVAREPLVTRYAILLRQAVIEVAGRRPIALLQPWPNRHRWAAAITHDLDVVEWWGAFTSLRLAELASKARWREIALVIATLPTTLARNPVLAGLRRLLAAESEASISSTWFLLCGDPSIASARRGDLTYRPDSSLARRAFADIGAGGHEIGLHGSFDTMLSPTEFARQRARLAALGGSSVRGVRQHYLRMRPGETQRAMRAAGFTYDATFGYPDASGFRLGSADIVPYHDAADGTASDFDCVPLVWMDRTLSKYQGVEDPERWIEDAMQLARVCAEVEGLWVGLWHPNLSTSLGYPGAEQAYQSLLGSLQAERPYIATLDAIVGWRRQRRAARARAVDATGQAIPFASSTDPLPALESAIGVPVLWATP